jgi:5'-AMP-activated protein kinase regulatory beta subunit
MSTTAKHPKTKANTFICHAPEAKAVFLAGTFNDWKPDATPMTRNGEGDWSMALHLPAGRHEYKFVVDGNWCCEPGCDGKNYQCPHCAVNTYGTMNRVIEVS